jgi:hypothetical protein
MRAPRRDITPTYLPKTNFVFGMRQHAPSTLAYQVQS